MFTNNWQITWIQFPRYFTVESEERRIKVYVNLDQTSKNWRETKIRIFQIIHRRYSVLVPSMPMKSD
jgi:hypothetical protein